MAGCLIWRSAALFKAFESPATTLGSLDASAAATLIAASADLALVISERGEILDMSFNSEDLARDLEVLPPWLNRPWIDTVSWESRPKVEMLLHEAATRAAPRMRHLNHPSRLGSIVPILYSAVPVGNNGRLVAIGRDLRPVSELQQRLVDAQQSLEQDYARLRDAETRYRLLFQLSSEAVLILDAANGRISEANPAARTLFGVDGAKLIGTGLRLLFDDSGADALQNQLGAVRAMGRADDVQACLKATGSHKAGSAVTVAASLFREANDARVLVRVVPVGAAPASTAVTDSARLLQLVEQAPDGFVVIGADGRIAAANAAFLGFAELPGEEQARGEMLDRWFGRQGVDASVLIANLRQRGSVRLFATIIRGESGATTPVEVSAVAITSFGQSFYGLAVRDVGRRLLAVADDAQPRSGEDLTELIGRVPLKELVRQSTELIERMSIETSLRMTGDNRASAAEMLGLSRQSFYVKMRRYGLGDLNGEGEQ